MFPVVIDACVLFPFTVRDVLLRAAELDVIAPVWSDRILDEMERNLVARGKMDVARAAELREAMVEAFAEASVPMQQVEALEAALTNDPKDRHVLAAAIVGRAEVIVTCNIKDFPRSALAPWRVRAVLPDDYACELLDGWPEEMMESARRQVAELRSVATLEELLGLLQHTMPQFADRLRAQFGL